MSEFQPRAPDAPEVFIVTLTDPTDRVLARLQWQGPDRYDLRSARGELIGALVRTNVHGEWGVLADIGQRDPQVRGTDVFALASGWAAEYERLFDALPGSRPTVVEAADQACVAGQSTALEGAAPHPGGGFTGHVHDLADQVQALIRELCREADLASLRDVSDPSGIELTRRFCDRLRTILTPSAAVRDGHV
ncbi:hypothetical protein [Actinomadura litoris]|uniref:hypothetical protein n=1 Tax=Actinomadura litoris TaxID=2678616 RepID=UPI001FA7C52D|nr:hypothetical protein [Actinomadura litoris]